MLFVGTLIYFIYAGTQGALWMHLMTFYWQLDTKGIQWIQYAGLIGAICGIPLAPQFNRWFDKKWTVIVGVSVGALADTVPVLLKLFDADAGEPCRARADSDRPFEPRFVLRRTGFHHGGAR